MQMLLLDIIFVRSASPASVHRARVFGILHDAPPPSEPPVSWILYLANVRAALRKPLRSVLESVNLRRRCSVIIIFPMIQFHFLGAPRLEKNNRRIEPDTRKAIALAAYLALTRTAHERDELAVFLYPEADATHARAALRRTLSTLKTALGETVLDIERETIALNAASVRVDVQEFCALAAEQDADSLTRAAQLYQGDFLAGFTLRDSPAFDEWQFFQTESLRKQLAAVLEQLVAHETERRGYKRAIEYARRWLALDPLHEPAHRALMLLYARDGQRAAALRQYRECVRQLDSELGVAPLPETTTLYHAIQENREIKAESGKRKDDQVPGPFAVSVHEHKRSESAFRLPPSAFPFVGRVKELELLLHQYRQIHEGGRLLVIQGEAGIGKTRLAEEFLAQVANEGATVLTARSYVEQRALAYAPFVQALRGALNEPPIASRLRKLAPPLLAEAARLVPELGAEFSAPPPDAFGAQARFFDAVTQVILTLAQNGAPGVLFLDDAQWLDEASLDLLAFLIRRLKSAALCILLTWRREEVANDHALRRLYADELRQERAALISLTRLAPPEAATLVNVAAQRGAPIDAALAERLYRDSEGQPFFLIESLKLIEREGQLPAGDALPASVRELLHSRLAYASETARQLLSAAAIIGRSFEFEILDAVSGRSEQETILGLEELVAQGFIVQAPQAGVSQYDFTHEKLRALVYEETLLARRRLLHRRAGEALTQRGRANLDAYAAQIAGHYRAGGDEAHAADYYKRAGDYARALFANREQVENYSAALALGYPDAVILHIGIGDAQTLLGAYDAALAAYETAAAFGAATVDANMARVYLRRGEWARAARHLQNALEATDDAATQAVLYADLALTEHQAHEATAALKHAQRALKLAQKVGAQGKGAGNVQAGVQAQAQAHNMLGILARTRGEWDTASKHLEASRALAEKMNDLGAQAAALNNLALVYHARRDEPQALELAQQALELVTRAGDRHRQAALHNHIADLFHALGRDGESMQHLRQAVAIYTEIGGPVGAWQPEIWKLEEW